MCTYTCVCTAPLFILFNCCLCVIHCCIYCCIVAFVATVAFVCCIWQKSSWNYDLWRVFLKRDNGRVQRLCKSCPATVCRSRIISSWWYSVCCVRPCRRPVHLSALACLSSYDCPPVSTLSQGLYYSDFCVTGIVSAGVGLPRCSAVEILQSTVLMLLSYTVMSRFSATASLTVSSWKFLERTSTGSAKHRH